MAIQYFGVDDISVFGVSLEARFLIALELVKHLGIATALPDGEDSAGRTRYVLLPPEQVAARAFAIANALLDIAEQTNSIRPALSVEELAEKRGRLDKIQRDAAYGR